MGKYYDTISGDAALKTLADAIHQNNPALDVDMCALCAKAGEGAIDIVKAAMATAHANGVKAGAKVGDTNANKTKATDIKKQLDGLAEQYKTAQTEQKLQAMVSIKNRMTELRKELNAINAEA